MEEIVEDARREILEKAAQIIPRLIDIADSLGLNTDDININWRTSIQYVYVVQ